MAEKTIFPGMATPVADAQASNHGSMYPGMPTPVETKASATESKPVMGFLYSVSKTTYGEYWPLYVGPNTIGRGAANAICLSEASVSDTHATVVIRKMQKQGSSNGIFVFVQDTGSMFGTQLNGDTLDFNPRECKSGDIITIGTNYELLLIIIDPEELGLHPKPDFQSTVKANPQSQPEAVTSVNPGWIGFQNNGNPKGTIVGNGGMAQQPSGGYSEGHQSAANPFDSRKATIYMPKK